LLRRLRAGGQTIVLVTHADAVAEAADRIVRMRDGRIDRGTDEAVAGSGDPVFGDLVAREA
jgi:putative ABC transport system ATP-binding protein